MEDSNPKAASIASFCEITSSSEAEAQFFLESHNFDLDAAVSTFFDNNNNPNTDTNTNPPPNPTRSRSASPTHSPSESYSPSHSPSRSRSPSPAPASRGPYELRSRRGAEKKKAEKPSGSRAAAARGGVRTLADLNWAAKEEDSDSDEDERQEYYTGGQKSGMLVQDPGKVNDVEAIFNQAKQSGAVERPAAVQPSSSRSKTFTGTARLLSGETVPAAPSPQRPEIVNHTITFWRNGFTVNDGPLRRLDDPENASFLESITRSECPQELQPVDRRTSVHVDLVKRDEDYKEVKKPQKAFQGEGRTLGSSSSSTLASSEPTTAPTSVTAAPSPCEGLVVDESSPITSIQLRLADGTRMVSRFNFHHTIRDIRAFIDASRPGGSRNYQLQMMGFPPKQLTDLNQTIEQAGLANSVVIQKY